MQSALRFRTSEWPRSEGLQQRAVGHAEANQHGFARPRRLGRAERRQQRLRLSRRPSALLRAASRRVRLSAANFS
ncbi:unnamed protein product [Ixodes pacificus]